MTKTREEVIAELMDKAKESDLEVQALTAELLSAPLYRRIFMFWEYSFLRDQIREANFTRYSCTIMAMRFAKRTRVKSRANEQA